MLSGNPLITATITCVCSYLSLIGSLLIIGSYVVARSKSTPKSAFLILHLATSDFFWFLAASTISSLWLTSDGQVPPGLCYLAAPVITFTRMASLIWTCVVSFNVLMSVQKRKWFWKSQEQDWENYRKLYFCIIFIMACPATLMIMIGQYTSGRGDPLGCSPESESIGDWYLVLFTELLPISFAFCFNIYVFVTVRQKMSKSAFPQSVRKKRKRVMYHYIIVCILCWIPTIALELTEIFGLQSFAFDCFARLSLYISGFLNFLVFGMQDPHLKKSFEVLLHTLGCGCLSHWFGITSRASNLHLKSKDVDKNVMFNEDTVVAGADLAKDRFSIYRNRKLSREDKQELYQQRPDLDPKFKIHSFSHRRSNSKSHTTSSQSNTNKPRTRTNDHSDDLQMEAPLLGSFRDAPYLQEAMVSIVGDTDTTVEDGGEEEVISPMMTVNSSTGGATVVVNTMKRKRDSLLLNAAAASERALASCNDDDEEQQHHDAVDDENSDASSSAAAWSVHDLSTLSTAALQDVIAARRSNSASQEMKQMEEGLRIPLLDEEQFPLEEEADGTDGGSSVVSSDDEADEEDEYLNQPAAQQ